MAVKLVRHLSAMLYSGLILCACAGQAAAFMPPAASMEDNYPLIESIKVDGAQRLDPETVMSHLSLSKGAEASPSKLDGALKSLYATGLFSDVTLKMEGKVLLVKIAENPIINRVTFEGNEDISKEDLEKEVQAKTRMVYTFPRVDSDVQRILDLYRRQGHFGAKVEPKIVKLEQNRVDLVFEISEGDQTGVRSIAFVGNEKFSSDVLREAISTRESAWWRFLSNSDYYDPDRLGYDKELLRKFYLNEGYIDFRVLSAVAELTPDRDDFFMTFSVEEGKRYKIGKINISSEIKGVDSDILRQFLSQKEGDWYNADMVEKSATKITAALGDKQYAFAVVTPSFDKHKETQTIDLTFNIKQGARVYVGRVDINGNTNTVDKVIRREMRLAENDPYSVSAVKKSEQRIKDLGFFSDVKVTPVDGAQPDRADLNVDVKEKSTGEVMIGAGYSSTDGPLGDFSISQRNFMGRGQAVRLGATISGRTSQIETSFTEPYFLDKDLSAGIDLYATETDYQDLSSYDVNSAGFATRLGYPLSENLRQKVSYTFHADEILHVLSTASLYVREQAGSSTTSAVGQSLVYDTRDSKLEPTLGYITHFDTDIAGVGGSRKWVRLKAGGTQYYPVAEKWIFSATAEAGKIWGMGQSTRINERFFLGGDTLRGFQYAGIGPRDMSGANQDALGGTSFARSTVNLAMPTPLPSEFGIRAHLFTDVGFLGDLDGDNIAGVNVVNDSSVHLSVGAGVTWDSPFGPIRLDFAKPIMYKSFDRLENIHFSFGTKF